MICHALFWLKNRAELGHDLMNPAFLEARMKTELTHLDALLLGGVSFYGDPISSKGSWDSENEIGKTCKRFTGFLAENPGRPYSLNKPVLYEVHIYGSETPSKGYFEVFVGEEVNSAQLPVALSTKYIASSDYLKVRLTGKEIVSDWWRELDPIIAAETRIARNGSYIIQAYDERFKGMDRIDDSSLDVFIPIVRSQP